MIAQIIITSVSLVAIYIALHRPKREESALVVNPRDLREVAELATVEYTIKKIIKYTDKNKFKNFFGSRKILFSSKVFVKAGIRLSNISSSNICIDKKGESIILTIPKPEIISFDMPPEECNSEEHTGILRSKFSSDEQLKILRQGEEEIRSDINDGKMEILNDAKHNAECFLESTLRYIGFKQITIKSE